VDEEARARVARGGRRPRAAIAVAAAVAGVTEKAASAAVNDMMRSVASRGRRASVVSKRALLTW